MEVSRFDNKQSLLDSQMSVQFIPSVSRTCTLICPNGGLGGREAEAKHDPRRSTRDHSSWHHHRGVCSVGVRLVSKYIPANQFFSRRTDPQVNKRCPICGREAPSKHWSDTKKRWIYRHPTRFKATTYCEALS